MANPLKMLKLKPMGFQEIKEVSIDAAPKKVWSTILIVGSWFYFDDVAASRPKHSFDAKVGGQWSLVNKEGASMLMGILTMIEPGKLLRIGGPLGMTQHVPKRNGSVGF